MVIFKSEAQAFKAGGDVVAALCRVGKPNAGLRVLKCEGGFKVLILPDCRGCGLPFYI